MFDLSFAELAVIVILGILVMGPKELPVILRTAGRGLRAIKRLATDMNGLLNQMMDDADVREAKEQLSADIHYIRDLEGNLQRTYDLADLDPLIPGREKRTDATPKPASDSPAAEESQPRDTDRGRRHLDGRAS